MNTLNLPPEQEAARQIEEARRRWAADPTATTEAETALRMLATLTLENRKRLTRIETRVCKIAEMLSIDVK